MIDNKDMTLVLEKLENLEDEVLAVEYLKKFNDASKKLGKLLLNLDQSLDHGEWKKACDESRDELDKIVLEIMSF